MPRLRHSPKGPNLHIYKLVVDSMLPDSTIQSQAQDGSWILSRNQAHK